MNLRFRRIAGTLIAGALLATSMAACSEIADPDKVGIWYAQGQSDGNKFDHCVKPGNVDDVTWNDSVYWLPNSLRTWNIAPSGGDTNIPLVVTAKPEEGQQSGTEVNVWVQVNFMLNTYCGADERDGNAPFVQWWQKLGDRYDADTNAGWVDMLNNTIIPALEKSKNELRAYTADQLVLGTVWGEAEPRLGNTFSDELERLSGGDYFCGPDFDRSRADCSSVQVSIKDVDYKDVNIQAARNAKQVATENAAAQVAAAQGAAAAKVAEAEGNLKAAQAQQALYGNAQWMQLRLAEIQLEQAKVMAEACKTAGARCIIGGDGHILIQQ